MGIRRNTGAAREATVAIVAIRATISRHSLEHSYVIMLATRVSSAHVASCASCMDVALRNDLRDREANCRLDEALTPP